MPRPKQRQLNWRASGWRTVHDHVADQLAARDFLPVLKALPQKRKGHRFEGRIEGDNATARSAKQQEQIE